VERPRSYDLVDKTKTIGPGEAGANRPVACLILRKCELVVRNG